MRYEGGVGGGGGGGGVVVQSITNLTHTTHANQEQNKIKLCWHCKQLPEWPVMADSWDIHTTYLCVEVNDQKK